MMVKIRQGLKLISALAVAAILSSCAGVVSTETSSENRDTSGRYDGLWTVTVAKGAEIQYIQSWEFNCGNMSDEFEIFVENGTMNLESDSAAVTGYVSNDGKFKVSIPIISTSSSSSRSDVTLGNVKEKIILSGNLELEKPVGRITYGISEFGWTGCTSKTQYRRVRPSV